MGQRSLTLGRNITVNFAAQALIFITAFFTTPYILSHLGDTYYGLLIFLSTVVAFISALDFGLSPAYIQLMAEKGSDEHKKNQIFFTTWWLFFAISFLGTILIWLIAPILLQKFFPLVQQVGWPAIKGLRIFSVVMFFGQMAGFLSLYFQAKQQFQLYNLRPLILGVGLPLGTVWLLALQRPIEQIFYLHLVFNLAVFLLLALLVGRRLQWKRENLFSTYYFRQLFYFAKWKIVGQLCGQIRQKSSRFFLGAYVPLSGLTVFSVPQSIADKYVTLQPNITSPVFAMSASLQGENQEESLKKLYVFSVKLVNITLVAGGLFLFFFSPIFLSLWIGEDFSAKASGVMQVLLLGMSLSILNGLPTVHLESVGKPAFPAIFSVLIVSLFLIFSFILIPKWGVLGAAWVPLLTYSIQVPIYVFWSTKKIIQNISFKFFTYSYFLPIFLALIVAGILYFLLPPVRSWAGLIARLLGFLLVYYQAVWFTGIINPEEKSRLKELITRFLTL
jgi:O-antigen/teichoic acid export membrane protein